MVMIESLACGTPVVALRGGAVPEIVVDGVTGFVCEDPAELPDAIARLDEIDPGACRARVADHFDVAGLGAGYEAVYRSAVRAKTVLADPLDRLKREYRDLDAGLDRRFDEGRRLLRAADDLKARPALAGPFTDPEGEVDAA